MATKTPAKKQSSKITVLLSDEEYGRFDAYCEAQGFKKSTLIARLIREYLDAQRFSIQRVLPLSTSGTAR
jgi:metal-responsive CopG/Arc/MetJ family transcriptional regulator